MANIQYVVRYPTKKCSDTLKFPFNQPVDPAIIRANAWADWLKTLEWKRFCTFTTGYELTLKSSRRLMERFYDRLTTEVYQGDVTFFWVAEQFEAKYGYHTHGLLNYDDQEALDGGWDEMHVMTKTYQIVSAGRKMGKWNRVSLNRYDKNRAGAKYCAKYLLKRCADFDLLIKGSNC